jgi:hypothetical protein
MPLDPEQDRIIRRWLAEKVPAKCPACDYLGPVHLADLTAIPVLKTAPEWAMSLHTFMPTVTVLCPNCGYVRFFSAFVMGLRTPEPPRPDVPPNAADQSGSGPGQ